MVVFASSKYIVNICGAMVIVSDDIPAGFDFEYCRDFIFMNSDEI